MVKNKTHMSRDMFANFVKEYDQNSRSFEIDIIFKHFDVNGFGQITKENFVDGFTRTLGSVDTKKFEVELNDVIKPLITRIRKQNKTVF